MSSDEGPLETPRDRRYLFDITPTDLPFMPDILIRNLDANALARLKSRAKRHHRSLQAEARLVLERAAGAEDVRAMLASWKNRLADRQFDESAALIREDRDR
jgi:plasmid stability protein